MSKRGKKNGRAPWMLLVIVLLVALTLAACGGGANEGETPAPGGEAGVTEEVGAVEPTATEAMAEEATPTEGMAAEETPTEAMAAEATATESGGAAAGGGELQGEIRIAVVRGAMIETMRKLADQFQEANPGVKVNVEEEPEGGAFEALIAAGNQPDIIVASFGPQIGRLAAQESAVALEDMDGAQELFSSLEPATVQQLYGHNYYVPIGADVTMLIYNKQLFEAAGLDPESPPQTWDEFLQDAEAINNLDSCDYGDRTYGTVFWNDALQWGGWYWNMLQPMYLNANQAQCQLMNRLGTDIVFDQPECQMAEFFDFNAQAQAFAPPTMEQSFFSRCIGMWPQYGYSWEPNLNEAAEQPMVIGEDVGIAPVPSPNEGDTQYTTYGGRGLMILKTEPAREELAWQFIQFLMQEDTNLTFLKELGYLPTLTSLKDDEYFQDPARQPFVDALENGLLPEQLGVADDVANTILGVYQQVAVEKSIEPDAAVTQAADQARAELQQ